MDIESFDSVQDLMNHLQQRMRAADAQIQPWQAEIRPGQYFMRPSGYGFPIYGEVLAEEGPREPPVQHYRRCCCYSIACPEGEMGDVHVSTIERLISGTQFEEAREHTWQA